MGEHIVTSINRRNLLGTIGGAAATAALMPTQIVSAQENKITVTSLGGRWEQSIREDFIPLFEKRTGAKVDVVLGGPAQWMSQIESQPSKPPLDCIDNSETLAFKLIDNNMAVKLTTETVPNLAFTPELFRKPWDDYAAMYMYAGAGFFYNKEKIKDPPKTWIEFFDRAGKGEFGKSVSLPDIPYGWTPAFLWTYAKVLGGDINKMDPAFDMLKKIRPHVVKFWANAGEIERMISSREVDIGVFWDGRVYSMIDAGAKHIGFQRMSSDVLISGVCGQVVKGGNEKLAAAYVNAELDAEPQLQFFKKINYAVSNANVKYPDEVKDRILPVELGLVAPYRELAKITPTLIERWNQEVRL
jgi:putative spermidine/putrescine transport system substrate-binding protein